MKRYLIGTCLHCGRRWLCAPGSHAIVCRCGSEFSYSLSDSLDGLTGMIFPSAEESENPTSVDYLESVPSMPVPIEIIKRIPISKHAAMMLAAKCGRHILDGRPRHDYFERGEVLAMINMLWAEALWQEAIEEEQEGEVSDENQS
jgi:hypothetical protein